MTAEERFTKLRANVLHARRFRLQWARQEHLMQGLANAIGVDGAAPAGRRPAWLIATVEAAYDEVTRELGPGALPERLRSNS